MRFALLVLLPLAGCLVVPSTHKTSRHVAFETAPQVRKGLSRGLALTSTVVKGRVVVKAIRTRDCHREVFDVIEVTERRSLHMAVPQDPRAGAFAAVLAPVTLPISLLISSISVGANHESHQTVRAAHHVETTACTEPAAGLQVDFQLASGARFLARTDANGVIAFSIGKDEPARGLITARAETEVAELKYRRKAALAMRAESLGE
jgi:hypothetical protein